MYPGAVHKSAVEKVGGAGWDIVVGLAKEYAKQEIKAKLGIALQSAVH